MPARHSAEPVAHLVIEPWLDELLKGEWWIMTIFQVAVLAAILLLIQFACTEVLPVPSTWLQSESMANTSTNPPPAGHSAAMDKGRQSVSRRALESPEAQGPCCGRNPQARY